MRALSIRSLIAASGGLAFVASVPASAGLAHQWTFDTNATDSVGGADLSLNGSASIANGSLVLPGGSARTNNARATGGDLDELADTITGADAISVVIRYNTTVEQAWSKTFMAGSGTDSYLDHTPVRGNGQDQGITLRTNGGEKLVSGVSTIAAGTDAIAIAIWDAGSDLMSIRSVIAGDPGSLSVSLDSMDGLQLSDLAIDEFYLGSATGFGDADFNGTIDLFQVYDHALGQAEINQVLGVQLPGDTDGDGDVDADDINTALANFTGPSGVGKTVAQGDVDDDGDVDVRDMMRINEAFTGSAVPVPEPASLALLGLGGLLVGGRRR